MKHILFILTFFVIFQKDVLGSKNPNALQTTHLEIKVVDTFMTNHKLSTIIALISEYPFGGSASSFNNPYTQSLREKNIVLGKKYNLSYQGNAKFVYLRVSTYSRFGSMADYVSNLSNIYVLRAGSNLKLEISEKNYSFTGLGSSVLNFQTDIFKVGYSTQYRQSELYEAYFKQKPVEFLKATNLYQDSILTVRLNLVKSFGKKNGEEINNILIANVYGQNYWKLNRMYNGGITDGPDLKFFNVVKDYYKGRPEMGENLAFPDEILLKSPMYTSYLIEEMNLRARLLLDSGNFGSHLPDSSLIAILGNIDKHYSNSVRDKLKALFFLRYDTNPAIVNHIKGISETVKDTLYKKVLVEALKSTPGVPAVDFKLTDSTGRKYSLKDFEGKVVLMDFWYTGCTYCAALNKVMKPVYEYFKGNEKIVMVNVSIDKKRNQWVESLRTNMYSHENSINLYTDGNGSNIDFIKAYGITGYPRLILIKDGRIVTVNVPDARVEGTAKVIDLLKNTIKN